MKYILSLFMAFFLAFVLTTCEEDETTLGTPQDEDFQPISDNMKSEQGLFTAATYMSPYGLDEDLGGKKSITGDPEGSYDSANYIYTWDFTNADNKDGKIIIDYAQNPFDTALTYIEATTTLQDFTINSVVYNGSFEFTFDVQDDQTVLMSIETIDDTLRVKDGTKQSSWYGDRQIDWYEGFETLETDQDDYYKISGDAVGVTSDGSNYKTTIESYLIFSPSCPYVKYGTQIMYNYYETEDQTTLTMTYHVDDDGNELSESDAKASCNASFNLKYEDPSGSVINMTALNIEEL